MLEITSLPAVPPERCPACSAPGRCVRYGRTTPQRVHDTPWRGKRVELLLRRQRFRCRACGATFFDRPVWLHDRHRATLRWVEAVARDARRLPKLTVAQRYGVDDKTVFNVLTERIGKGQTSV